MKKSSKLLQAILKLLILFFVGGIMYVNIETLARGFSHWTMFIVGGLCFMLIGLINEIFPEKLLFQYQCGIGAGIITLLEFVSGYIINIVLKWNVWDYSDRPFNLLGQICLHHSVLYWLPLSALAIILDDYLRFCLYKEPLPDYKVKK